MHPWHIIGLIIDSYSQSMALDDSPQFLLNELLLIQRADRAFCAFSLTCFVRLSLQSSITPRYFTCCFKSTTFSNSVTLPTKSAPERFLLKSIRSVFSGFPLRPFSLHHLSTILRDCLSLAYSQTCPSLGWSRHLSTVLQIDVHQAYLLQSVS